MSVSRVCQICTGKKKTVFLCPYCRYESCVACNERVILESINLPACTSCRKPFSDDFLHETFPATFLHTRYRQHRQNLLFEREKALLPSTQTAADQERQRIQRESRLREARARLLQLRREMQTLRNEVRLMEWRERQVNGPSSPTTMIHVASCPVETCRGFVEQATWACGLCHTKICDKCREVVPDESHASLPDQDVAIQHDHEEERDDEDEDEMNEDQGDEKEPIDDLSYAHPSSSSSHVCNPDTVATIRELAQTTKPCPNCQVPIFKVNGCDQMWCVKCNVAFSWNTGEIERGLIHNPHYYEYLRNHQGDIPRNPNEERNGGMPPAFFLHHIQQHAFEITRMYRRVNHIRMVYLRHAPTPFDNVTNRDLRIQYLLQQLSEEEFKDKLQRREKERAKWTEARAILDMYCNVVQDLLQDLYRHGALVDLNNLQTGGQSWSGEMAKMVVEQEDQVRGMSIEAFDKMNRKYQSKLACPLREA